MYNDLSHSKYSAPVSEEVLIGTAYMFATSDLIDGNASLEDFEVIDLCE